MPMAAEASLSAEEQAVVGVAEREEEAEEEAEATAGCRKPLVADEDRER